MFLSYKILFRNRKVDQQRSKYEQTLRNIWRLVTLLSNHLMINRRINRLSDKLMMCIGVK